MSPKTDVEVYIRRHLAKVWLPDDLAGPFDPGLFLRVNSGGELVGEVGQWGLIRPGAPARKDMIQPKPIPGKKLGAARPRSTNNARSESVATSPTFRAAWGEGRRCLIPATWYQEPNWEAGRNVWWQLKRADGLPWMLAGIWNVGTDPATGEIVPSYTMLTCNCDGHPLLGRLHKPDWKLPPDQQDKRAVVHLEPKDWSTWLSGSVDQARDLIRPAPAEFFDQADAVATDELLAAAK